MWTIFIVLCHPIPSGAGFYCTNVIALDIFQMNLLSQSRSSWSRLKKK